MAGDSLDSGQMQNIAREMNFSETTFITGGSVLNGYDVRIFTPTVEVPFAGHPVLGTAYVIASELEEGTPERISLNLSGLIVDVTIEYERKLPILLTMRQSRPEFGQIFDKVQVSNVLRLPGSAIVAHLPVQEVNTGLPFIIVPVDSLESMESIILDSDAYYNLISNIRPKALLAFSLETVNPENQLHIRMFAPFYGIAEDPATGSGGGCLAAYLLEQKVFEKQVDVRAEQGVEIGRSSLLRLWAEHENAEIAVRVGGEVIPVSRGILL